MTMSEDVIYVIHEIHWGHDGLLEEKEEVERFSSHREARNRVAELESPGRRRAYVIYLQYPRFGDGTYE
jgi:hypothetical protein